MNFNPDEPMTFLKNPENYNDVFKAIESKKMRECSAEELTKHAEALCVYHYADRKLDQVSAALFIQHLLLGKLIDRVQSANQRTGRVLTILTVAALIAAIIQATAAGIQINQSYRKSMPRESAPSATPSANLTDPPGN